VKLPSISPIVWVLSVLALLSGAVLVAASEWSKPLAEAEQAEKDGRFEVALERYAAGEARFERLPITRQVLPEAYEAAVANQLALHYRLGNHDAVLEKASVSPSTLPAVHFWAGCALFQKTWAEQDAEARLSWLGRSADEFRKTLEGDPENWDAKYNYELTARLLAELRKQPKTPPQQMLQLLRPQPKAGGTPARRVG
jgi:hypothetical protein